MEQETRTLAGRYTLLEVIGTGGMGRVWRAEDSLLRRRVAIKEVRPPHELPDRERAVFRERVLREARAAAGLNHSSAVTIFDVVDVEGEYPFIVMELLEAPTLDETVQIHGPLDASEAARVGAELAGALALAHERGIVHRDVKPANVMLTDHGTAKLTDFGIATVTGDPRITASGLILGSPSFMSPEQAQGQTSGPPSDVWGLGSTLYFALTARLPFHRDTPLATLAAVVNEDIEVPPGGGVVGELACAMLSKDPADRPTMANVQERLAGASDARAYPVARDERPTESLSATVDDPVHDDDPADAHAHDEEPRARHSWVAVAAGVILLVAALAGLLFLRGGSDEEPPAETRAGRAGGGAQAPGPKGDDSEDASEGEEDESSGEAPAEEPSDGSTDEDSAFVGEWTTYENEEHGFAIEYPLEWDVLEGRGGPTSVDFVEPGTGNYLRFGYRTPPGSDVLGTLRGIMDNLAARHPDYVELRLEPTEFGNYEAAIAEYTFSGQHAVNLQFVTGPPEEGEYGFALNFVADESQWETYAPVLDRFEETFTPPPTE